MDGATLYESKELGTDGNIVSVRRYGRIVTVFAQLAEKNSDFEATWGATKVIATLPENMRPYREITVPASWDSDSGSRPGSWVMVVRSTSGRVEFAHRATMPQAGKSLALFSSVTYIVNA